MTYTVTSPKKEAEASQIPTHSFEDGLSSSQLFSKGVGYSYDDFILLPDRIRFGSPLEGYDNSNFALKKV